jgi:hypothetical protein
MRTEDGESIERARQLLFVVFVVKTVLSQFLTCRK